MQKPEPTPASKMVPITIQWTENPH